MNPAQDLHAIFQFWEFPLIIKSAGLFIPSLKWELIILKTVKFALKKKSTWARVPYLQTGKKAAFYLWAMTPGVPPEPLRSTATLVTFISGIVLLTLPSSCVELPCPPGTKYIKLVYFLPPAASLRSPLNLGELGQYMTQPSSKERSPKRQDFYGNLSHTEVPRAKVFRPHKWIVLFP